MAERGNNKPPTLKEIKKREKEKREAAAAAQKPVETPAPAKPAQTSDSKKKVLNQNNASDPKPNPLPQVDDPSRRTGATPVTVDRREEREEKRFNRDRAEWDRQHRIQRLEELDRDWRRQQMKQGGSGHAKFTTRFNGRKARTTGSWYSNRRTVTTEQSPYAAEINQLLRGDGAPGGYGASASRGGGATPDWMPKDMSKEGGRFDRSDFFGRDNRGRSSRFGGGYLSADFRENFINSRMEGLQRGDAGYDAMRRKAEGAWSQAVKQYDREWQQYGQEKLREQSRLDFQKKQQDILRQRKEAQQEANERATSERVVGDMKLQRKLDAHDITGYDRDAKAEGSQLTNREVEALVAETVRDSTLRTGVAAQVTVGTGANSISARSYGSQKVAGGVRTVTSINGANGASVVTDRTRTGTIPRMAQVGDTIGGGAEMNRDRVAQNQDIRKRFGAEAGMILKQDNDTFELMTGMKREQSAGVTSGGRYAGNGKIVYGDQKTFDSVVAQNQQRRKGGLA